MPQFRFVFQKAAEDGMFILRWRSEDADEWEEERTFLTRQERDWAFARVSEMADHVQRVE